MDNRITGSGEPDFDRMRTDDCHFGKAGPPGCEPASAVESGTPTFLPHVVAVSAAHKTAGWPEIPHLVDV